MTQEANRRTPLYEVHKRSGGRMVPFAGWDMPVQYAAILDETRSVRTAAGMFDVSHMARVRFTGPDAPALLQRITTNDAVALQPGFAQYSLLPNPEGGLIDDIIVYRVGSQEYMVVLNAGNASKDLDWIRAQVAGQQVEIDDQSAATVMIAVQGPQAPEKVAKLAGAAVLSVGRFAHTEAAILGHPVRLCRTGYTGEDGFEIVAPAEAGEAIWSALAADGVAPCGLGARDVLRIEAGYPLYGHEIDDTTTPVEAGLMWAVKLDKGDFIGRETIARVRAEGPARRLMGLSLPGRIVPRQGYTLYAGDRPTGTVTSGVFSPTVGHSVAMAYIETAAAKAGTEVEIEVRGQRHGATVVQKKNLLGC